MSPTRRELLVAAAALGIGAPLYRAHPSTFSQMTGRHWQQDLAFLYAELQENHRDLFHHTPEGRFRSAISDLHRRIPRLRPLEIVAGFQSIVALAGDGHTFLSAGDLYRSFPFETAWFDDGVRVVRTTPEMQHLLGMQIKSIDGRPIAEISGRLDSVIPQAENAWYLLSQRPERLRRAELLAALGVIDSPDHVRIQGDDIAGRPASFDVTPLPAGLPDGQLEIALGPTKPATPDPSFGWARLGNGEAVHLQFRRYDDLARKAAALFDDLRAAPPRVLLIDLRDNRGGNYTLPREHIIEPLQNMPALNRKGRLHVLIGRHTFSAAMTNASDFRRETEALLVGEPTGARPNGYQELHTFRLPHSQIRVACSIRHYRFDSAGRDAIYPDLHAPPDWPSLMHKRDNAVEAALAYAQAAGHLAGPS
ncbi:hypothetical protein [Sphingosinicella sp. CPCC 101087]|uniref:hypothetical protein n=1 Tax=Sphingosinicella sp. CPCC 101087 TaxID=2497754 RepID=UPI00101CF233|nr:hypothetical protein [Sphingosinicella sp. CPCC 101087]